MRRRLFIGLGGLAALGAVAYVQRNALLRHVLTSRKNERAATFAAAAGEDLCVLLPEQTEGPYYFQSPVRSSIGEDRPGLPLSLLIEVVRAGDCSPVEGAMVEIWHCDATGAYSGYGDELTRKPFDSAIEIISGGGPDKPLPRKNDAAFLRGGQIADTQGRVRFETIFPGWYAPRATHIHLKVSSGGQSYLTTQLYFPDELCNDIHEGHAAYAAHGLSPYTLKNDFVLRDLSKGTGVILQTQRTPDAINSTLRVAIS